MQIPYAGLLAFAGALATIFPMPSRDQDVLVSGPILEPLQLSAEPMRTWVNDDEGRRVRPVMCVVVGQQSTLCLGMDMGAADEPPFELAARVLSRTLKAARVPGHVRVQVRDPELATALRHRVELAQAQFEVVDRLDAVDYLIKELEADLFPSRAKSPLDAPAMSIDRLRAFADGAAAFYAARPWRNLHDDDLIQIESPKPPAAMKLASVLGAGGQVMGIAFFRDQKSFDGLTASQDPDELLSKTPRWSLMFHDPDEVPSEDAELWEEHGLRVTPDETVPLLLRYRGMSKVDRPDGEILMFVEGLCRALAATTESEIDSGRWEKTVRRFDGEVTYRLSIPHLLEPPPTPADVAFGPAAMERSMRQIGEMIKESGAQTVKEMNAFLNANVIGKPLPEKAASPSDPKAQAIELCYLAQGQRSRRELQLLREALRFDPDCADAYVQLAQRESDPAAAEPLYRKGVEAGKRALGEEPFTVPGYPFWGATESRPFMRAMSGLAEALDRQDRLAEAADVLAELLRLNPGDNQGVRYRYVPLLIEMGRLDEARALVESKEYQGDISALWDFAAALIAFEQKRPDEATALLKKAAKRNPFAPPMILNPDRVPPFGAPGWSPGDESEGVMIVDLLGPAWRSRPAAMSWLFQTLSKPARRPAKPKRKPRK